MSANNSDNDDEGITGINVTPLVDVMLVLLVIFMVTANYIAHNAMPLDLPKAASGEDPGETNLNFTLNADSQLFLDGAEINFTDVKPLIKEKMTTPVATGGLQALISADRKTPHGSVIRLMDLIKTSGISNIAFNVEFALDDGDANPKGVHKTIK